MKTTIILASAFIFFALSVNSSANDKSDNILNSIELSKSDISLVLIGSGRNKSLRNNVVGGVVKTSEKDIPSYENIGRNKQPVDLYLSMH